MPRRPGIALRGRSKKAMIPIRVISFLLFAACAALCQQLQEKPASSSLPDAPSVQASAEPDTFRTLAASPLTLGAVGADRRLTRASQLANATRSAQPGFALLEPVQPVQKVSGDFFDKHLYPSLLERRLNYHPACSNSLMGRATYAASRIFVTRDDSGKDRLNTSYFLGVLTSAVIHTAYRPYWRRSPSQPF